MHYSFESWKDPSDPGEPIPEAGQEFPFSEDLQELEASLSMGLEESLSGYRPASDSTHSPVQDLLSQTIPDESRWDELAKVVADHVTLYLEELQNPLQAELARMRRIADEYHRDNRAMADQIRRLIAEREAMRRTLEAYERELTHYRPVLGNLHIRL